MKTVDCFLPEDTTTALALALALTPAEPCLTSPDPEREQAEADLAALLPPWGRESFRVLEIANGEFIALCDARQCLHHRNVSRRKLLSLVDLVRSQHWVVFFSSF